MTVDLRNKWNEAVSFERWLDEAEANKELWHSLYRRAEVSDELLDRAPQGSLHLLVLAEDWCGDAVNTLPWLARLAEAVDGWELRVLRRDEHMDLMASHTTGGAFSIPVVMLLDQDFREIDWWGPRPAELQRWVLDEGLALPKAQRYRHTRRWYARDRGRTSLTEILALLSARSVGVE